MTKSTYIYLDKGSKTTGIIVAGGPSETGNGCDRPLNSLELKAALERIHNLLSQLPDNTEITRIDITY